MYHRFASTVLTCKYTGLLRAAQGIRRKFFGGHAKTAIRPRPGVVPPCKPAVDRPTLTTLTTLTDPPLTDRKSAGLPVPTPLPTHNRSASQTVDPRVPRPSDRKHPPPYFRSGHARISLPVLRIPGHFRTLVSKPLPAHKKRPHSFLRGRPAIGCGGNYLPPPFLFSAGITPRPLSWQRLSWPTWPRQPPWRSSERPVRRCRRASSSRPRR